MAWNQPGSPNNNPWGKKPAPGGGDLDQAFKDWQKRIESLFGGGGGRLVHAPADHRASSILAIWMLTGFYQVKPGNQGVVQRFGKHVETVGDGWGWRLPWPIETVTKVDVAGVKSIAIQVARAHRRTEHGRAAGRRAVPHQGRAKTICSRCAIPSSHARAKSAKAPFAKWSGATTSRPSSKPGRIKIAEDTRDIMQRTLDQYGAGIEVRSVNITDVQVPEAVQQAQRDSVKAKADRERMIKEAQAYANGILPDGRGQRRARRAGSRSLQVAGRLDGDRRCLALHGSWPWPTKKRRTSRASACTSRPSRACSRPRARCVIDSKSGNGNMLYLPLDKLMERSRESDGNTVTVRPPVGVEPDPRRPRMHARRVER